VLEGPIRADAQDAENEQKKSSQRKDPPNQGGHTQAEGGGWGMRTQSGNRNDTLTPKRVARGVKLRAG
jgi:hypothetical protein